MMKQFHQEKSERNYTTIEIPRRLHRMVKIEACKKNRSVKRLVEEAITAYCRKSQEVTEKADDTT